MRRLQFRGDKSQVATLFGDPNKQVEPEEVRIEFPGGAVSVTRVEGEDGNIEYWAHTSVFHEDHPVKHRTENMDGNGDPKPTGKIIDARIDRYDKGARETIELAGALDEHVDHVAVRIRPNM